MAMTEPMDVDDEWDPDESEEQNSRNESNKFILHHVLLPRYLPPEKPTQTKELELMRSMIENTLVDTPITPLIPNTLELFKQLKKTHIDSDTDTLCTLKDRLKSEINSLVSGNGGTFVVHMNPQNCMLLIHKRAQKFVVATFRTDIESGDDGQSDIEYHFPSNPIETEKINEKMLKSDDFIKNLCYLYTEKSASNHVSTWLVPLLAGPGSKKAPESFPVITKKLRNERIGESKSKFFERSHTYLVVKSLLQHTLAIEFGDADTIDAADRAVRADRAKFVYKIIMLQFLNRVCAPYTHGNCTKFNIELLSQMIAKLARRIEKMLLLKSEQPYTIANEILIFFDKSIENSKDVIKMIRTKIDRQINDIQENGSAALVPLTGLDFNSSIKHEIPEQQPSKTKNRSKVYKRKPQQSYQRHFVANRWPYIEHIAEINSNVYENGDFGYLERRLFWIDFENCVLYSNDWCDKTAAATLRTWAFEYTKYGLKMYAGNMLSLSRLILVYLKIIAELDRQLCAKPKYALLCQHRSGVDPKEIDKLLLPQRIDMEIACKLQQYFKQRNNNATGPSLIEEKGVSVQSFAVEFAKSNDGMKNIRQEILDLDQKNVQCREKEWKKYQKRVVKLRGEINSLPACPRLNEKKTCKKMCKCDQCKKLRQIKNIKINVYEHLLPKKQNDQWAIAFELDIPTDIACLRDMLYSFSKMLSKNTEKQLKIKDWVERCEILDFNTIDASLLENQIVRLGYTIRSRPNRKFNIEKPIDELIIKNKSNCIYHGETNALGANEVKTHGQAKKFEPAESKAEERKTNAINPWPCAPLKINDEYRVLQWTMHSTAHTQNEVLATHTKKCPKNLSSAEYIQFGSLRADGHRLQMRKLYAAIASETLSFEKESVLSLIMQTLWQYDEPSVEENATSSDDGTQTQVIRESHIDFLNNGFCSIMLEQLTKYTTEQQRNWMHPYKMLMVVVIAVRIFEINDESYSRPVVDQVVKLLNKIRTIAFDWIEKIGDTMHDQISTNKESEEQSRLKLIYAAIIGALTFFVHPKHQHFELILSNRTAAQQWLHFIITLQSNTHDDERQLPSNLRIFLRLIERIAIDLETSMKRLILADTNQIHDLIRKRWQNCGQFGTVTFHPEFAELLIIDCGAEKEVSIDIITGSFLVNGFPLSRLPSYIVSSDLYKSFFGNLSFEVQQESRTQQQSTIFSTTTKYNDCIYIFKYENEEVFITEIKSNDNGVEKERRELINPDTLRGNFPETLVKNYSHWLNKNGGSIEFRKRFSDQRHFSNEPIIDYRFDSKEKELTHVKTKRRLLNIKSECYKNLVEQLERLEHSNYMLIYYSEKTGDVTIELPRMKLKFKVVRSDQEFQLESNEFGGMRVSRQQNIGTLYGLNHGLILESAEPSTLNQIKILLVPNGKVQPNYFEDEQRVSVDIDFENGKQNPPFYKYEVDNICGQLKSSDGSYASWFYLAYLHAVTSHGQIEPFTGLSGTERALQILQSAYVWSSAPYEPEAMKILKEIEKLSPIRSMNKINQIQSVKWPDNIPHHAAQDTFVIIVNKLLADSQCLHELHLKTPTKVKTKLMYNEHDYHRCLQLQPNVRVNVDFIKLKELQTSVPKTIDTKFSQNTQLVSILYHTDQYQLPNDSEFLKEFLIQKHKKSLKCLQNSYADTVSQLLHHKQCKNFADIWMTLYEIAVDKCSIEEFTLVLSILAHQNNDLDPILALQAIARNPDQFRDIEPPKMAEFNISAGTYSAERIKQELGKHFSKECETNNTVMTSIIDDLGAVIEKSWPCSSVEFEPRFPQYAVNYDYSAANVAINKLLASWFARSELDKFIQNIQDRLSSLNGCSKLPEVPEYDPIDTPEPKNWLKFNIDAESQICDSLCDEQFGEIMKEARDIWNMNRNDLVRSSDDWWAIILQILQPAESKHLIEANLFPRTVPTLLLPKIIKSNKNEDLKALIGAYALTIAHEQYKNRPNYKLNLDREMEDEPHTNWNPCDRPEWLLFEIEQNLTIRKIQVKVANQMINPPEQNANGAKHSVMQLNMGQGKTKVIIPMLASVLSNGEHVCQITVPKALLTTNLRLLRAVLGGILNQRIYMLPCRRDLPIMKNIGKIQDILEECITKRGVILTQSDYRLSFQLKMYESIEDPNCNIKIQKQYMETYRWTIKNVRNILDESDTLLQPNYQLIYTIGDERLPDGGQHRWMVIQALLKRVPHHIEALYKKWKNVEETQPSMEYDDTHLTDGNVVHCTDIFPQCRIFNETIFDELKLALADEFLDGKFIDIKFPKIAETKKKDQLRIMLTEKDIDQQSNNCSNEVLRQFADNDKNTIWILSGFLRFEVLKLVLTKRWRVNYGVDPSGRRKMAVPFKAKDCPADMAEFGHPDVAICLTQLSYYYSGLTDDELYQLFKLLKTKQDAQSTYQSWIDSIPRQLMHTSIESYKGLNLDDSTQRNIVFSLFRKNMNVINFFLSNIVYPREAKVFDKKFMCSAWDLCNEKLEHPVTGFSGTNDIQDILPLTIVQNDLPELKNTNAEMEETLKNGYDSKAYRHLPQNANGMAIIKALVDDAIPVLLDSGALMLELTNEQVAIEWLKLVPESKFDAAVYFDSNDVLQTIDRDGIVTELECSVYRDNLSRCVVYMDDVHTRGTDLKFPLDWKACVTLSGDITRDKVMQSCMRMRQLGKNQKICFWASYEAGIRLREKFELLNNQSPTVDHVIEFITDNNLKFQTANMIHWSINALNYTKKMVGHKFFEDNFQQLYKECMDNEYVKLSQAYGISKKYELLTKVVGLKFSFVDNDHVEDPNVCDFVHGMKRRVIAKLVEKARGVKQFWHLLDCEQQTELQREQQQEFEVQRHFEHKFAIVPTKPKFNEEFQSIVEKGITDDDIDRMKSQQLLHSIPESLSNTHRHEFCETNQDAWAPHLFVSRDFKEVIEIIEDNPKHDEYLRPVMWILQIKHTPKDILIMISSYECNKLLPAIRDSQYATLFMYQPKLDRAQENLLHDRRLHVTGQSTTNQIKIDEEVQIGVFAGSMYFNMTAEQNAYCGFLGLIPEPWNFPESIKQELKKASDEGEILVTAKGFVPEDCRKSRKVLKEFVGQCKFNENPVQFAIKLIEMRHQSLQKESHVASILEGGRKSIIEGTDNNDDEQMD